MDHISSISHSKSTINEIVKILRNSSSETIATKQILRLGIDPAESAYYALQKDSAKINPFFELTLPKFNRETWSLIFPQF